MTRRSVGWLPVALAALATIASVAGLLLTVLGHVLLGAVADTWDFEHLPADWRDVRARWLRYHDGRIVVHVVGFVAVLAALVALAAR